LSTADLQLEPARDPGRGFVVAVVLASALSLGLIVAWDLNRSPSLPSVSVAAPARHPRETDVCREIAQRPNWRGNVEVELNDDADGKHAGQSRIDIKTETHAWEADWAHKWPEAIGQASYYSLEWNRTHSNTRHVKPGVLLLVRDPVRESHYLVRCRRVCDELGITLAIEAVK
jgi:hypothetical protein